MAIAGVAKELKGETLHVFDPNLDHGSTLKSIAALKRPVKLDLRVF